MGRILYLGTELFTLITASWGRAEAQSRMVVDPDLLPTLCGNLRSLGPTGEKLEARMATYRLSLCFSYDSTTNRFDGR